MQLSEDKMDALVNDCLKITEGKEHPFSKDSHVWTDMESVVNLVLERARADARPFGWWYSDKTGEHFSKRGPDSYAPGDLSEYEVKVTPLYTHPEASAPVAWEATTIGYRKYLTQSEYENFDNRFRKWYKPYRCSACANREASAPGLSEREIADTVNKVRDIALQFHATQQLRGRIARVLVPILTRASAATVAEPGEVRHPISGQTLEELWLETGKLRSQIADLKASQQQVEPRKALTPKQDAELDAAHLEAWQSMQQAEPSEPWREKLIELADQLDAELTTGVQWSNAQFACFCVSDDLRKIVKKAGGAPNEKDWKARALEAEKLNRQFMERWNAENGPTHMGEPVIAAQQQAKPPEQTSGAGGKPMEQQAEPGADERAASEAYDKVDRFLRNNLDDVDYVEYSEALDCVLAAQSGQRAGVAEGWQLVPVDPTDDMQNAYQEEQCMWNNITHVDDAAVVALWKAMLAAAPTQQQEGGK